MAMTTLIDLLIGLPAQWTRQFAWIGPLLARLVVGWSFLWSGWWKLTNLESFTSDFADWGIVYPQVLAPFVAGLEFIGGILLLVGLFTQVIAIPLAVVMIVATVVDKAKDIDSLASYTDLIETVYLAVFIWLAVAGAGAASLDHLLLRGRERRALF
jgi:putative oxidoreductase